MSDEIKIHNRFANLNRSQPKSHQQIGDDTKYIPEEYKNVAKGMESQFVELMLKQMEQTTTLGEEDNDTASGIYKNWLNTERSKIMTNSKNKLGIQDLILDEIYPKKFRNQMSYNQYQQMQQDKLNLIKRNRAAIEKTQNATSPMENVNINRSNQIRMTEENSHE